MSAPKGDIRSSTRAHARDLPRPAGIAEQLEPVPQNQDARGVGLLAQGGFIDVGRNFVTDALGQGADSTIAGVVPFLDSNSAA